MSDDAWKAQLQQLRKEIDETDAQMLHYFKKRMDIAQKVAAVKRDNNLAVKDENREQQVVDKALAGAEKQLKGETALFMRTVMALSREYQHRLLFAAATPTLPPPSPPATKDVVCTYQGVPGAWSEAAAAALFPNAERRMKDHFEDVFLDVKNGKAHYGVVPIENSKTGAIGETYDLLRKYGCYIVGRTWVAIRQCLVGLPGSSVKSIREVLSHPEGLKQCRSFIEKHNWEETACRNTAIAAKMVAQAQEPKKAAIASRHAAALYGLEVIQADVMDAQDNKTSFVVIAKQPQYNKNSNLISITFSTMHRSGALCEALLPVMAENLNLMRIESRPAATDKYRFFAEIQGNIMDEKVASALRQIAAASEYFEVLGCYQCSDIEEMP